MIKLIIALVALLVVVIAGTYLMLRAHAKKYCEFHHLNFKRFWHDELHDGVDTDNPYIIDQYKEE